MSDAGRGSSSRSASPSETGATYATTIQENGNRSASPEVKPQMGHSPKSSPTIPEAVPATTGTNTQKQTKRRAARACVSCRARKVRCDVVENSPCGNCKWDNVKCEVQESRRRKKTYHTMVNPGVSGASAVPLRTNMVGLGLSVPQQQLRMATSEFGRQGSISEVAGGVGLGVPLEAVSHHLLMPQNVPQFVPNANTRFMTGNVPWNGPAFRPNASFSTEILPPAAEQQDPQIVFPAFIKPLPAKLSRIDINYLYQKGALMIPTVKLQKALLKAYVEFVHPYMPLLELGEVLKIIDAGERWNGPKMSLLLFQAVMFVSVAFVDLQDLKDEDYSNRRDARKTFFSRVRALYDLDYEAERHVLVQSLLLMTYWYETPDDQKDTWHWMGVAISLAHTIGLHRNPANITTHDARKKRLNKRIWWSCFMRDRLIALGMRRPTRIQDEDFDVPMLEETDFEIEALPEDNLLLGSDCRLIRDTDMQRKLALMCIEKAKLCVLISRVLKVQYSVLSRDGMRPDNTTESTMMLYPNKTLDNFEHIHRLDKELDEWLNNLPECCRFRPVTQDELQERDGPIALHRTLLHMVYRATVAALHRPQFVPRPTIPSAIPATQIQEMAHNRVFESAQHVMTMAAQLRQFKLDRYLPTTGVTAILPAMIIHLFEMKSPDPIARQAAAERFQQGTHVLERMRQSYAAADFAYRFLEAAYNKLQLGSGVTFQTRMVHVHQGPDALGMMGTMTNPPVVEPSTPPLALPNHGAFMAPTEIDMGYADHSIGSRSFDFGMSPRPAESYTTTPESEPDSPSTHFGTITPESDRVSQRMPETTATICPQNGYSEPYSMSNQQQQQQPQQQQQQQKQFNLDEWLQFPAEGVSSGSDEVMIDILSNNEAAGDVSGLSYDWIKTPQHQAQQPIQQFSHGLRASDISDFEMIDLGSASRAA